MTWPNHFTFFIFLVAILGCSSTKPRVTDQLSEFAMQRGLDLNSRLQSVCAGNTNALSDILRLSVSFTNLDSNARSYGGIVYGLFVIRENMGAGDEYAAAVAAEDSRVQQRVRDFLYYSAMHDSTNVRIRLEKKIPEDFPKLFPVNYQFARDDQMFKE